MSHATRTGAPLKNTFVACLPFQCQDTFTGLLQYLGGRTDVARVVSEVITAARAVGAIEEFSMPP